MTGIFDWIDALTLADFVVLSLFVGSGAVLLTAAISTYLEHRAWNKRQKARGTRPIDDLGRNRLGIRNRR